MKIPNSLDRVTFDYVIGRYQSIMAAVGDVRSQEVLQLMLNSSAVLLALDWIENSGSLPEFRKFVEQQETPTSVHLLKVFLEKTV